MSSKESSWDEQLAGVIDHTILRVDATTEDVERACREAMLYGFAGVVVHPYYVPTAVRALGGGGARVISVVSFPFGAHARTAKVLEATHLIDSGADEIDMVMNVGAFLAGNDRVIEEEVAAVAEACQGKAMLKVILETGCLDDRGIERATLICAGGGANMVKTSTGFHATGATPAAVATMRKVAPSNVGVKASGGIRTAQQARALIAAGATRLGCSASLAVIGVES